MDILHTRRKSYIKYNAHVNTVRTSGLISKLKFTS